MFIIEYQSKHWTNHGWGSKKNAKTFESAKLAWAFIDLSSEDTVDISVVKVRE